MKEYKIKMDDIKLENIYSIDFVLEPVEGVKVYSEEIVDIHLEFDDTLVIGGTCIERRIKSGYIKLAVSDKVKRFAGDVIIRDTKGNDAKRPYKKKIENRLMQFCDICYIKITTKDNHWTEHIDVPFEMYDIIDEGDRFLGCNYTVCSSAKIDDEGNLIILFGRSSEFSPSASVWTEDDENIELTTINDYVKFWNGLPIETLKIIADDHEIIYDKTAHKDVLVALLKLKIDQYFK